MTNEQRQQLIDAALAARARGYARYSQFFVGAALLTPSGKIVTGANVENASYGLTICAERSAVFSAVSAGEREFTALAIASSGGAFPCGACRQVLAEFCRSLPILLIDADDQQMPIQEINLTAIFPGRFELRP